MQQMLPNLALNATQPMPEGQSLELITRFGIEGHELFVIDNGPGIVAAHGGTINAKAK
ncbi:ATP-binding protein [Stratiformator vulcanicus]|uniref:Uncharacterized protein n=1 Tax=Stratiformator vulcanicus TaxID=2527980 RepID=A0A517QX53_9PLAN|nr:ATP-binding protein [Stratiformator vulcanicus]QDT36239.1 hypothetical protein Pan189_05940 [Stratiformator vulcanicus]